MTYQLTKQKYLLDHERAALEGLLAKHPGRDAALILLALYTGARVQELLNVKAEDLDPHDKTIFIRGIKGSDDRHVPLSKEHFAMAQKYIPFNIQYTRVRQIWLMYRPVKKKFHCLRHTFAITVYRKTKDIRMVQMVLGHKSMMNTLIYAAYEYKTSEMRAAILG